MTSWFTGHSDSSCPKTSDLFHYFSLSINSDNSSPLVSKSAGFLLVGTYRHCLEIVAVWISPTRFATKGSNDSLLPLIHNSTFILSDHKVAWSRLVLKVFEMDAVILNPMTAAINSSRGTLVASNGATLVFAATNLLDTVPPL